MTAVMDQNPVDQAQRERIATETKQTLFVEAGAGSGKTSMLVRRIVALVYQGAPLRQMAAVTFTDKAAAELRDRLRVALAAKTGDAALDQRLADALDDLDGAAIGTLHSFARRILVEHPIEAGLPPLIEVLDEVGSRVVADRRWDELQTQLLEDADTAPLIRLALAAGITLEHLRTLAQALDENWDLVEQRLSGLPTPAMPTIDAGPLLATAAAIVGRLTECTDHSDGLADQLRKVDAWVTACDGADDAQLIDELGGVPGPGNKGKGANWDGGTATVKEIKQQIKDLKDDVGELRGRAIDAVLRGLLTRIAADTLRGVEGRVAEGRLRYQDLLVLARNLVRDNVEARAALADRYRWLLLDEFQDTDRLQIEIAVRIAGGRNAVQERWEDVDVPAGALFVVGDPKQSIYRFRRADISTYLLAQNELGGETVRLSTNFRSTRTILSWVNTVFAQLIHAEDGAQPAYEHLDPSPAGDEGEPVLLLGKDAVPRNVSADQVRATEARDIAALIATAVHEGWQIRPRADEQPRALTPADITVLVPTRTSIGGLETELNRLGVPYRTEAATFVYSAPEVRELLLCARAVDDPTDELAIVCTLRSPLFGCTAVDLWRWKSAGKGWYWRFDQEPEPTGSVAAGLRQLALWSRERSRRSPSELLADMIESRRVLEVVTDTPRYRETWRRLRFVVDQARAWSESEHGSLREYLAWAARQAEDTARVVETVLPETDSDAVRITTIHASKGLEFPMVILAGLSSRPPTMRPPVLWPAEGGCEIRLGAERPTLGYGDADGIEQRHEHCERLRLLYVAATRAVSRLVVSLHRNENVECPATWLADVCADQPGWSAPDDVPPLPLDTRATPQPAPTWAQWSATRDVALDYAGRRAAESATHIAHHEATTELPSIVHEGLDKQPRDLDLPPWRKGRYGTEIGRAVHGVLQTVPLNTGEGLDELAAAQALAEDIPELADDIAAAVRAGLGSPLLQRVATRPNWRETYVGTVIDGTVVEGYVDLLYRDDDGLVIVDYKTDVAIDPEALAAYSTQVSIYARAIEDAVGEPVVRGVLLFLRPGRALEHVVLTGAPA